MTTAEAAQAMIEQYDTFDWCQKTPFKSKRDRTTGTIFVCAMCLSQCLDWVLGGGQLDNVEYKRITSEMLVVANEGLDFQEDHIYSRSLIGFNDYRLKSKEELISFLERVVKKYEEPRPTV